MSTLAARLADDLKTAMRAGDTVRRDELRGLLAALKGERQNKLTRELVERGLIVKDEETGAVAELTPGQQAEVERLRATLDLTDGEEEAVLQQRVKQHRQSIEGFSRGKRADLVATEEAQLAALQPYLPQPLSPDEIDAAIRAAIGESGAQSVRDMRKVMDLLSQRLGGRADMRQVGARVQQHLAGAAVGHGRA